jgi:hypothetical protein
MPGAAASQADLPKFTNVRREHWTCVIMPAKEFPVRSVKPSEVRAPLQEFNRNDRFAQF